MLNHIVVMGRLVKDPELRSTQQGTSVCNFTIACDRDYQPGGSDKQVDFIDVVAWKGTGEIVAKYFRKGSMIVTSGRLQSRKWEDRDGNKRINWEISADNVYFGESRRDSGETRGDSYNATSYGGNYSSRSIAPSAFSELEDDDGELPF